MAAIPADADLKPPVGRGKNYNDKELKQLCLSFLHVSQDPAVGNGQKSEKFWTRIQEHYNDHRPHDGERRGRKSLEGKWADIKHDVAKFVGCYSQIEDRLASGTNDEDTLKNAKELYRENHPKGKPFTYESAWKILKDVPRWHSPADDMARTKNTVKVKRQRSDSTLKDVENGNPEIILTSDADTDAGTESNAGNNALRRPIGNKKAKEENKRARMTEDVLRMTAEAQIQQAEATKDMAKANFMRARTMENNVTIQLLAMPIESFSPELKAFVSSWKLEEAIKLKERMQAPSGYGTPDPPIQQPTPAAPNNPLPFVRQPIFPIPPNMENHEGREEPGPVQPNAVVNNLHQSMAPVETSNPISRGEGAATVQEDPGEADQEFVTSLNQIAEEYHLDSHVN